MPEKVQCPLGNGDCENLCPNYDAARAAQQELVERPTPFAARLAVVFADAQPGITVVNVARVMGRCLKEASRHHCP